MKSQDIRRLFEQKNVQREEYLSEARKLEIEIYQLQGRFQEAQEREQDNGSVLRPGQGVPGGTGADGDAHGVASVESGGGTTKVSEDKPETPNVSPDNGTDGPHDAA